ncbi:MAG: RHS repeat-associated core domain-containing protein [Spirochaetes bacterium]|nr:RHS repeat-associated core domain-containing protein [Spirochaetota bacterium]
MYFGIEKHRTTAGAAIPDTDYAVNNIYFDGVRIAAVIPGGDARYYLTDQVDSVKTVVDDDGLPVSRMEYLPYGDTWFTDGDKNNAPKYNSQELDKETNFYYYNARHYNAEVSRFVTPDTVIDGEFDTQGWNRYAYVKGNPVIYKDPTGHFIPLIPAAAAVVGVLYTILTTPREKGDTDKETGQDNPNVGDTDQEYGERFVKNVITDAAMGKVVDEIGKVSKCIISKLASKEKNIIKNAPNKYEHYSRGRGKQLNIEYKDSLISSVEKKAKISEKIATGTKEEFKGKLSVDELDKNANEMTSKAEIDVTKKRF